MEALDERIARIEASLAVILPDEVDSRWLARVAGQECSEASPKWADSFLEPGRDLLRRGGKRWRPLVTVLTCEALGGGRAADVLAPLTEIPHNGSLIVDDIEDASAVRRGAPAVHLIHGEDLSINMGNLMYFLPSLIFEQANFPKDDMGCIMSDWLAVMRRLHLGQGYDILWHRESLVFPDEASYLRMCRFKTGSLASLAASLGVRAAAAVMNRSPASADFFPRLQDEGFVGDVGGAWEDLGTGFQILDDVQNLSSGIPGKDRGDDIVEGKKSLPVILHAAQNPSDGPVLAKLFSRAAKEAPEGNWSAVEEAISLITESGALAAAREKGRSLLADGRFKIENLLPQNESRDLLISIVDAFVEKMV